MRAGSSNLALTGVCAVLFFIIGALAGAAGMAARGYRVEQPEEASAEASQSGRLPSPPRMPPPPGGGGPGGMGMPGGGMGGGRGPSPKAQLAGLVAKLDQLTQKPLFVELSAEQKAKLREQLDGLAGKDDLSDDDAKKRLDAALELLKDHKGTMEAAGFRWPGAASGGGFGGGGGGFGGGGGRGGNAPANPFKEGATATALKALNERLQ